MSVLILGSLRDFHVRAVQWALGECGIPVQVLTHAQFPTGASMSAAFEADGGFRVTCREQGRATLDLADLSSVGLVWCRRPLHLGADGMRGVHPDDLPIVQRESEDFMLGLAAALSVRTQGRAIWVNPIESRIRARSKLCQLSLAHACGLSIPPTLVSNDPDELQAFHDRHHGRLIFKAFRPLDWGMEAGFRTLPTTRLDPDFLRMRGAIQRCPLIYQAEVKKRYELRVLICGDELHCLRVDSQHSSHTATDWRLYSAGDEALPASRHELSDADSQALLAMARALGILYGCADLIVDQEGRLIFLEINQQGQFLFMDHLCPGFGALQTVTRYFGALLGVSREHWPALADYQASSDFALYQQELPQPPAAAQPAA